MSRGPRVPSVAELKRVGVTTVSDNPFRLKCDSCGAGWAPDFPSSGTRLHVGYWKCPNGCNAKEGT